MAPINQLWASIWDLNRGGPPVEALSMKTAEEKLWALRAGSAQLASYIRGRYKLPLTATAELSLGGGLTAGQVTLSGTAEEVYALVLRFPNGGTAGAFALDLDVSTDGGDSFTTGLTLPLSGEYNVAGQTITVSGPVPAGATITVFANVDWAIKLHAVSLAAYSLLYNRGVDPSSPDGQELKQRAADARTWAMHLQDEKAKLEEGSDATPTKKETGPAGTGCINPWDFLGSL